MFSAESPLPSPSTTASVQLFRFVLRWPSLAQHFLGDLSRGRRSFDLAGSDRLLHQGTDQVPLSGLGGEFRVVHEDAAAGVLVDEVQFFEYKVPSPPANQVARGSNPLGRATLV
jgi:hypothetical protein